MIKYKGHGSIRKMKKGATGVLFVSAALLFGAVNAVTASADEVSTPAPATVATESTAPKAEAPKVDVENPKTDVEEAPKAETPAPKVEAESPKTEESKSKEVAPKEEAPKTEADLSKSYQDLKSLLNENNLRYKEEKAEYDTIQEATEAMDKQVKTAKDLIAKRDQLEKSIADKVKEAEALRMIAYREDEVVYKTVEEAKKATEKQLADLQNDIQLVAKTKKIVEKLRFDLTNAGVTIEPQTEFWKNSGKSKAEFNSEVKDFIKYTNSALKAQREAKQAFEQVIADYRAKGLDITVDGIEGYRYSAVEDEVLDIKIKLDKIYNKKLINDRYNMPTDPSFLKVTVKRPNVDLYEPYLPRLFTVVPKINLEASIQEVSVKHAVSDVTSDVKDVKGDEPAAPQAQELAYSAPAKTLPNTGEKDSVALASAGVVMAVAGLLGLSQKRRQED